MHLEEWTFWIFPAYLCKGMDPIKQTILSWLWFHKNKEGKCHPSQGTLEEECGISHRTLNYKLKELESEWLISRRLMKRNDNSNFNTEYELRIVKGSAPNALGGSAPNALGSAPNAQEPYPYSMSSHPSDSKTHTPPTAEGTRSTSETVSEGTKNKLTDDEFEAFWKKYPRKESKSKSKQIMERLVKKTPAARIMQWLDWYLAKWKKEGTEAKYIPMPTTFLNWERYMDSPETAAVPQKRATFAPVPVKTVSSLEEVDLSVL